ncbi:MAG: hypothetical protein ACYC7J_20020 [Syntrophales bacterium]
MKKTIVRRVLVVSWLTGLMLILTVGAAFAWEAATHAYIEEYLYKQRGQADEDVMRNRIYGANAIDIFNNNFTSPYLDFAAYFHSTSQEYFLEAWQIAATTEEKAFAYGFVSHNNKWGMDSTAHVSGITYGRGTGYVIAKAKVLAAMLGPSLEAQLGLPPGYLSAEVLVNLCHYLVESGVDFLILEKDPAIGSKLMNAAFFRSDEVPALLVNAYEDDFADLAGITDTAAGIITTAEANFQISMMNYGWALTQPNALDLVAQGLAGIGVIYLGLPPGSETILTPVAKSGIQAAMMLCRRDFEREIEADTGWVNGKLSAAGVVW